METRKLNVFISQPMSNKSKDEIFETKERIIKKVKDYFQTDDLKFMKSYFETKHSKKLKNESLYFLSKSLKVLSKSDVIIMASGWENSRGCKIEYECARLYDIMVIYEDTEYITRKNLLEVDHDSIAGN